MPRGRAKCPNRFDAPLVGFGKLAAGQRTLRETVLDGFKRGTYPGAVWHDIVAGSNGDYLAAGGYDNVTAVGSLNGYNYMIQIPRTRIVAPL